MKNLGSVTNPKDIATKEYVDGAIRSPATSTPLSDGTASVGSSAKYAREDHVHPSDTTKANVSDIPSASDATPQALGAAAAGSSADYSRADHVHAKPTYSKSDVGLGNVDNVQQYSASNPPPYPVTSVNGSTGAVMVNVPSAATSSPVMDGTAAVGSSTKYAKEDHVHPTDTSRQAAVEVINLIS